MISRILIQGSGSAGSRHLEIARQLLPDAEIALYLSHKPKQLKNSVNKVFTEINDAISFNPNVAIIAGASSYRIDICVELAKIGTHLLVEKPISNTLKNVDELIKICKENNCILAVGYNLQFDDALIFFRDKFQSQFLGKPLLVQCSVGQYLPNWRSNSDYRDSVSANSELGGGVLLELSHEINYLEWIFGSIEWVRATILRQSSLEIDVEDSAILNLGIKNSDNSNLVANLNMDFIRHDRSRSCIVIAEFGTLKWDGICQEVSVFKSNSKEWELLFTGNTSADDVYVKEWKNFLHCVNTGDAPQVSGEGGLRVLEVIDAALKSAPTGIQTSINRNP